jgi:hypothetical protein
MKAMPHPMKTSTSGTGTGSQELIDRYHFDIILQFLIGLLSGNF